MTQEEMMEDMWQQSKKQTELAERQTKAMERLVEYVDAFVTGLARGKQKA